MKKAYLIITDNEDLQERIQQTLEQDIDPLEGTSCAAVVDVEHNTSLHDIILDLEIEIQ